MKLKPLTNSYRAIRKLNRVFPRNNSFVSNNSEMSINNVSSTTNASRVKLIPNILPKIITPKNNYILKNIKIHNNFRRSSSVTSLSNLYSPSTMSTKSSKQTVELIFYVPYIVK